MLKRIRELDTDRGDVTLGPILCLLALFTLATPIAMALVVLLKGKRAAYHFGSLLIWTALVTAAIVAVMSAVMVLSERANERAVAKERPEWEPSVRRWLNISPDEAVDDWHMNMYIEHWRTARRAGVTPEVAELWSEHGFTPTTAMIAAKKGISLERVQALAGVMYTAGVCAPGDRMDLESMIVVHCEPPGGNYPVLDRWLAFDLDVVRARVMGAVTAPEAREHWHSEQAGIRNAAEQVLYDLEDEAKSRRRALRS